MDIGQISWSDLRSALSSPHCGGQERPPDISPLLTRAEYTTEQILGLAPNYYHIKSARSMASVEKWSLLGLTCRAEEDVAQNVAWGEFAQKKKAPLQTSVNVTNLAFSCTCSGRHFPCTHALALTLLLHEQPESFAKLPLPEWLHQHQTNQQWDKTEAKLPTGVTSSHEELATQIQKRQQNIEGGLQELKLWLHDLIRGGLAQARTKPKTYWDDMANRLVDAQASEVARMVKQLPALLNSGPNWPEQLLSAIGKLYLLIQGIEHFATLDTNTQSDLRGAVGWFPRPMITDQLLTDQPRNTVRDHWFILGKQIDVQRKQKVQRIWLWGQQSNRPALIVNVTYGTEPTNTTLLVGMSVDAELCYSPSNTPLRAELVAHKSMIQSNPISGNSSIQAAMITYAQALAANPWIGHYPIVLSTVQVQRTDGLWFVQDSNGVLLPLPPKFVHGWHLAAIGHGAKLSLFGEWDGKTFTPLSLWTQGSQERFMEIHLMRGLK